jgi:hypothetical protein
VAPARGATGVIVSATDWAAVMVDLARAEGVSVIELAAAVASMALDEEVPAPGSRSSSQINLESWAHCEDGVTVAEVRSLRAPSERHHYVSRGYTMYPRAESLAAAVAVAIVRRERER